MRLARLDASSSKLRRKVATSVFKSVNPAGSVMHALSSSTVALRLPNSSVTSLRL